TIDAVNTLQVTVRNDPPTNLAVSASASSISEGDSLELNGSFQDAGVQEPHLVTIDWRDGSPPDQVNLDGGVLTFGTDPTRPIIHRYVDNTTGHVAAYLVSVTVADAAGSTGTVVAVAVRNVAPTPSIAGLLARSPEGTRIQMDSRVSDPGPIDTAAGFSYGWLVTNAAGTLVARGSSSTFDF